jgi:hypothetical protein
LPAKNNLASIQESPFVASGRPLDPFDASRRAQLLAGEAFVALPGVENAEEDAPFDVEVGTHIRIGT